MPNMEPRDLTTVVIPGKNGGIKIGVQSLLLMMGLVVYVVIETVRSVFVPAPSQFDVQALKALETIAQSTAETSVVVNQLRIIEEQNRLIYEPQVWKDNAALMRENAERLRRIERQLEKF